MSERFSFPGFSLRTKLVLSYLLVALSAILILTIVVSLAVQNYFASWQKDQLQVRAENLAQQIGVAYRAQGGWDNVYLHIETDGPVLLVITDASGHQLNYLEPRGLPLNDDNEPVLTQALAQALHGQEVQGHIDASSNDNFFSGLYISVPLRYNGQANGQLIGALLLAVPEQYPNGFSPYAFLTNVTQAILLAGLLVALAVVICSFVMVRRLTRPLTALTQAAEQMKSGNYTQRVTPTTGKVELERLAVTFNAMADTIEADVNELRHQEQWRRDLLANIAHDLATPLTAIQGFSEALADNVITDPEARQETAQLIGREVQRLRRLVSDMQQMTLLESGRIQLDQEPLDLHTLVDEVLEVILPECEQVGISLRNEIDPTTPAVLADSDRMTQVLLNLLDNARRYTPVGGRITIGAKIKDGELQTWRPSPEYQYDEGTHAQHLQAEGAQAWRPQGEPLHFRNVEAPTRMDIRNKWLTVWVSDTGTGINARDLPYIFDRFFRSDRARSGESGGSGLGLAIIKAIITAHGGTICAESTPGKGTCITFTLPLA